MRACSIAGCSRPTEARGWCRTHYMRWRVHGDPLTVLREVPRRNTPDTFWARVDKGAGCWEWTGKRVNWGYGVVSWEGRFRAAHRVAYELAVGPIPPGLTIDHLCRNRLCCRPEHLEAVTNIENVMRGNGPAAVNARKTHCPKGHPYDAANTARRSNGDRHCRACYS